MLTRGSSPGPSRRECRTVHQRGESTRARRVSDDSRARLAESLYLESRTGPHDEGVMVLFEWGAFDDLAYLDEVEVAWETGVPDAPERALDLRWPDCVSNGPT